jgi:hypothetical protein
MERFEFRSVEASELTQVEGGIAGIVVGLGAAFALGLWAGGYAHDEMNGQNSMSGSETAAIVGALKNSGVIK